MLWDEGLLIGLRQEIYIDRDQIAAADDCLSTLYVPVLYVISGFRLDANEIFAYLGCYMRRLVLSDSSRQLVGPILKGQAVQEEFFLCVRSHDRRFRVSVCLYRLMWGKVKEFMYISGQVLSIPGGWVCHNFLTVGTCHYLPLSLGNIPGTHFY